jgi:D-sedoheptulose 7-phosphate isomerase
MTDEPTAFLYPFIDAEERDASGLVADLVESVRSKILESQELRSRTLEMSADKVSLVASKMAQRFQIGGRLYAFGNGGSSTDAAGAVDLLRNPLRGTALPAISLVDDRAALTALANDIGFEVVFSRQLIAHSRSQDIAMGFSTSGDSKNVLRAFDEASRRGLLTIGLSGYEGGEMARSASVSHCFVVPSESVHRIQEAQSALVLRLWEEVQALLGEGSML